VKSIWNWFRIGRAPASPLKGAPAHARTKTFSAETGYVYQYVFRGYRGLPGLAGTEFIFEASRDRTERFQVTVQLLDSALAGCAERIDREILDKERYALAKMTLFRAFDELEPGNLTGALVPDASQMEAHLRTLGRI
jgi:hypothetical protein